LRTNKTKTRQTVLGERPAATKTLKKGGGTHTPCGGVVAGKDVTGKNRKSKTSKTRCRKSACHRSWMKEGKARKETAWGRGRRRSPGKGGPLWIKKFVKVQIIKVDGV